jgi:hypothetical protein
VHPEVVYDAYGRPLGIAGKRSKAASR